MRLFSEYLIDDKLERYLIEDIVFQTQCYINVHPYTLGIYEYELPMLFESQGKFDNCGKVLYEICQHIRDEDDIFSINELTIDVSKCNAYCKKVHINIVHMNGKGFSAALDLSNKNVEEPNIILYLNDDFLDEFDMIEGMILHELMHGYENYNRIKNGKLDILSELSYEYHAARSKYNMKYEPNNMLTALKYLFDSKERNAYFGQLEHDIDVIMKQIDPSIENFKYDEIKKKIKEINPWDRYMEVGKFVLTIDDYDSKKLEHAYFEIFATNDQKSKAFKDKLPKTIRKASDIRKEFKTKWNIFNKKFNKIFIKSFCNCIQKKLNNTNILHEHFVYKVDPIELI